MALLQDSVHSSIVLEGTSSHESDFIFEGGVFYATFDGHKHPRKTASEIYTDLTYVAPPPTINDNGKRTRVTTNDATVNHQAHFYAAQLVHYGLKPLKTKALAKKKLLGAFGGPDGKTLEVPKAILELEEAMRRRGQSNSTSMEVDPKTMPGTQTMTTTLAPPIKSPRTKQTARKSTGSKPPKSSGFVEPRSVVKRFKKSLEEDIPQMTDAEIRGEIKSLSAVRARQFLELLFDRVPAVGNILGKEISSAKNSGASSKVKEKPVNPSVWTGPYDIDAPGVEDQYGDGIYSFEIYPSLTSKHLWASFAFGSLTGVMRSIRPVPNFLNTEVLFEWRGDLDEYGMTFDDTNRAVITFLPGDLLEGKMCAPAYGTYWLYGCRPARDGKPMPRKQQLDKVSSWKSEWRNTNSHNREVARKRRWGGYGGQQKEEEAFESDTTDGKQKRPWKIDLKNFMEELSSDDESFGDEDEW